MEALRQYRGLPVQIYFLALARAVVSMGLMFVFPFMSLLLTSVLGFSSVIAGYIMVMTAVGNVAGSIIGGKLSDSFSRKKVFSAFAMMVVIVMIISGFICTKRMVVPFIVLAYFFFSAVIPSVSAMVLDWCDENNKTEALSLLYLASNIGSSIGPVIAGLLFYDHMPWIFFGMAFAFIFTFVLVQLKVSEHKGLASVSAIMPAEAFSDDGSGQKSEKKSYFSIILSKPSLLIFIIVLIILTLCYIALDYMLPLHFSDIFGLSRGSKYSSLIWSVNGLTVVLLTPWLISFTKKHHQLFNMIFAALLYAAGFAVYGLTETPILLYAAVLIWTSGEILISTGAGVYISNQSPETHKGRGMATYEMSRGIGRCLGPLLFGYLLVTHTYSQVWLIVAAICLAMSLVMLVLYKKERKSGL